MRISDWSSDVCSSDLYEGTPGEILFAVLHCTGGDLLIASAALLGALLVAGNGRWPHVRFRAVAAIAMLGGLSYTAFSEWLNTEVRGSWVYTELRSEEHTSELQSLMRISYAVFCLKKKNRRTSAEEATH